MRYDNEFHPRSNKKWQLARAENFTEWGSQYPDYSKLHKFLENQYKIPKEYICMTNGAEEAVRIVLSYPSLSRLNFVPTWRLAPVFNSLYAKINTQIGVDVLDDSFDYDMQTLDKLVHAHQLIYLASPNAFTGNIIERSIIIQFLKHYPESIFVIDETYYQFNNYNTVIDLVPKYENLVVIRSYSKAHGLAADRFGFYATKNKKFIDIRPASPCSSETISKVIKSYDNVNKAVGSIKKGKKIMEQSLSKKAKIYRTKANFIVCEFRQDLHDDIMRIADFHTFDINGQKFIKLTALPKELAEEFVKELNA